MLKLYNTLTRKKQVFKPLGKEVMLYTCGLTVYDYGHIGNFRAFIFEDLLRRTLELNGFNVKHVQNFTDVGHLVSDADAGDDKMEVGARREHKTAWQIAQFYIDAFLEDEKKLRIKQPTIRPRATDNIPEMIEFIEKLEEKGYTYATDDGVYFDTTKFKTYGRMAKLDLKGLKAGARVEMGQKKNPTDFALWKFSKGAKRDMEWEAPFGKGFPGWHIECSVMAMKYLAETIDIHCGGIDHIPVHHTNEIAQSEALTDKRFANFWMHNEFMTVDGKKMSKSLGNFFTLRDLSEKGFSPLAFRYLCIASHYRSQMNFTLEALEDAENTVKSINDFVFRIKNTEGAESKKIIPAVEKADKDFMQWVNDDMNMPEALSIVFNLMKLVNKEIDSDKGNRSELDRVYDFMIKVNTLIDVVEEKSATLSDEEKKLIELREKFRKDKDYKAADEIRAQLKEKGIILEDSPQGVKWKRV